MQRFAFVQAAGKLKRQMFMTRRTLFKLMALFSLAGPAIIKALANPGSSIAPVRGPYLPACFPNWDKAVDGLENASQWGLAIERSRLPKGMVAPHVGQVWVAVRDCEVHWRVAVPLPREPGETTRFLEQYGAMHHPVPGRHVFGLHGRVHLREGEQIIVLGVDDGEKPLRVTFRPVRYDALEESIVPADIRRIPGYLGYELCLKTARTFADFRKDTFFNEAFELVAEAA